MLKKIVYKVVKKRMCPRKKSKRTCEKKCYRIVDGEAIPLEEDQYPELGDFCKDKDGNQVDPLSKDGDDDIEYFECDDTGNDISLLGSPGSK